MVFQDELGDFLATIAVQAQLLLNAQIVKAFVASEAMRLTLELGFSHIHIKKDCLIVIHALSRDEVLMSYSRILLQIPRDF